MTRPEPLPDTWYSRDFLVLREVARRIEAAESLQTGAIAETLGMDPKVAGRAGSRLKEDGFVKGGESTGAGVTRFTDLTAKGRREVGQWPSPDAAADRLLAALDAAIAKAPEGEQKGRLQKAREALGGMTRDLFVDLVGGAIRGELPLP